MAPLNLTAHLIIHHLFNYTINKQNCKYFNFILKNFLFVTINMLRSVSFRIMLIVQRVETITTYHKEVKTMKNECISILSKTPLAELVQILTDSFTVLPSAFIATSCLIPQADNQGIPFSNDIFNGIELRFLEIAGGYSCDSMPVKGAYVFDKKTYYDSNIRYHVCVPKGKLLELYKFLIEVKHMFRQEALYWQIGNFAYLI